jgi:hypothetical protein
VQNSVVVDGGLSLRLGASVKLSRVLALITLSVGAGGIAIGTDISMSDGPEDAVCSNALRFDENDVNTVGRWLGTRLRRAGGILIVLGLTIG